MNTIGDYPDLYLKKNILFLADVFERFINTYLEYCRLDSCHYFSSPGLSWDAMLKMTILELGLISNMGMQYFIEKGMRGGISYTLLKDIVKQIINTWQIYCLFKCKQW